MAAGQHDEQAAFSGAVAPLEREPTRTEPSTRPASAPGERFGRYEVQARLGQGAMGAVYRARDPALDRLVAVKTINPLLLSLPGHEQTFLERFRREARAAARLSHPNIVAVHDTDVTADGTPYIVMEHVAGVPLSTLVAENPRLPLEQALELVEQVGAALDEAHRHGIVHRDVKPANVLIDARGRAKVADFGIARLAGSELTQVGPGPGTPGYLPPEVLRGLPADARSDQFALGALAYLLLAGRRAFAGETADVLNRSVLDDAPEPPHALRPELPEAASAAVLRALAKDPADRFQDVPAFVAALRKGLGLATLPELPLTAAALPAARQGPALLALALGAALIALTLGLGALTAWFWLSSSETRPSPPADRVAPAASAAPARATPAPAPRTTSRPPAWQDGEGDDEPAGVPTTPRGPGQGKGKKKGHGKR